MVYLQSKGVYKLKTITGIARTKPENVFVVWLSWKKLWIMNSRTTCPLCDLCNRYIDWDPFPVIDYSSEEELTDPNYVPVGGNALCTVCAEEFYGLRKKDARKVKRLWHCFAVMQTND
jgi:hypothetical protein